MAAFRLSLKVGIPFFFLEIICFCTFLAYLTLQRKN